jgi:hypothetical protein
MPTRPVSVIRREKLVMGDTAMTGLREPFYQHQADKDVGLNGAMLPTPPNSKNGKYFLEYPFYGS